ncbi:DUF2922 domain-containing protein [Megasphaera sp. DISK 18]|uniref:DUF2922 domain-containing protein n=1 Tax=Megasphaera sp. DISK 18 TaxID=1776081 RepID=UPI0008070867|nr:DUF2922 domain-containing protein [Megasphaera sp. DISK 18]OBZ32239.1 hypothetical protein A0U42_11420 [Megasphaera sp. DISK 18]
MAIKSETKTLRLTFVDGINKNVSYSIASPKADLDKATVDAAANAIVDAKIFATDDGGNLTALKDSQIVTRKVETLE